MTKSVLQKWVQDLTFMQQSVLMSAIRGPDGIRKKHKCKDLIRYFRRCLLVSAFEGEVILDPFTKGGGSFTGPVEDRLFVDNFMESRDELPFHYFTHFMHAAQIMGERHSDVSVAMFWKAVYERMVNCLHLRPEPSGVMHKRLGDYELDWLASCDESGSCSS